MITAEKFDIKGLYDAMAATRQPYLDRGRKCADLVAPELLPPEGSDGNTDFERLYDSTGSQGLQSLVSKTDQVIFPTDRPFVRMQMSEVERAKLLDATNEDKIADVEAGMLFTERALQRRYVKTRLDAHMPNVFRHIYTTANVLVHITASGRPKVHAMDSYVVKRDHLGDPIVGVVREKVLLQSLRGKLPDEVLDGEGDEPVATDEQDRVELYTRVERVDGRMVVTQWALDHEIVSARGSFKESVSPFLFIWAGPVTGMDYSYSYVHTNYGDLKTLEELTKDMSEIAAAAAVLRWIVRRGSMAAVSLRKMRDMKNGSYVYGDPDGIQPLTLQGKLSDMAMVENRIADIKGRLRESFLMFGAARRNAERVTAFENAQVLNELQSNLSSFFGPLTSELQERIALILLDQMKEANILPKFDDKFIEPVIITGAAALSRETSTQKLLNAVQIVTQAWTPIMDRFGVFSVFVDSIFTGLGVPTPTGLWKDEKQIAQEDQNRVLESATPEIIKQAGNQQPQ